MSTFAVTAEMFRAPLWRVGPTVNTKREIVYPDSDEEPMADNTRQYELIVTIQGGIDDLFRNRPDVFVGGNLLWYPVEGDNTLRVAPDVMIAFGRPKGHRGSYRQWCENNVAPQVVFEILSPGNRANEMAEKLRFYKKYGVEEYYIYDPDRGQLTGWLRHGQRLDEIADMEGWISPKLGIRFHLDDINLVIYQPDGRRFQTFREISQERRDESRRAEAANQRAEAECQRAEAAEQRAASECERAETERQRASRFAAQLRALGFNPDFGMTPD